MNLRRSNQTLFRMLVVIVLVTGVILANTLFLMYFGIHWRSGENIADFKDSDAYTTREIVAKRGTIYDRSGTAIIAQEITTYDIALVIQERYGVGNAPAYVSDFQATADALAPILNIDAATIVEALEYGKSNKLYQVSLGLSGKNLKPAVKDEIVALNLPGIEFSKTTERNYPISDLSSQLIGYARYNDEEQKIVGEYGLESTLNDYLEGENGEEMFDSTRNLEPIPGTSKVTKQAVNGNDVILTLDQSTQVALDRAMRTYMEEYGAEKAMGMVVEVETGKILATSSYPSFDMQKTDIDYYNNLPFEYAYEPGSTMKVFTYAATLENGTFPYNTNYQAGSFYYNIGLDKSIARVNSGDTSLPPIKDAFGRDFGTLTFERGLVVSSNIAVSELITKYLPQDVFNDYLNKFGFFKTVDIPYVSNVNGVNNVQNGGQSALMGSFGQGSTVTAIQMMQAYSAIFNDGVPVTPYVVDRIVDSYTKEPIESFAPKLQEQVVSKETTDYLKDIMFDVVEDPWGSAHRYQMTDVSLIGKTGTGQIANEDGGGYRTDIYSNSVMIAAPKDDPKVMAYMMFESGQVMSFSGEPFKEVFQQALIATNVNGKTEQELEESSDLNLDAWEKYEMPSLTNHSLEYANRKMEGMNTNIIYLGDGDQVLSQYPEANETVISGQTILVATNGASIHMPNMLGWTRKEVTAFWALTGIEVQMDGFGRVVSQDIAEGSLLSTESIIHLTLE